MKKKRSLRLRICFIAAVLVAITMIVSFIVSEGGYLKLRDDGKNSLVKQSIKAAEAYTVGKTSAIDARIKSIISRVYIGSRYIEDLYSDPDSYVHYDVPPVTSLKGQDVKGKVLLTYTPFEADKVNDPALLEEVKILSPIESYFSALKWDNSRFTDLSIYTVTGISMGYDDAKDTKVDLAEFNPEKLEKDYYLVPKNTEKDYITEVYEDMFGRGKMITVSFPFRVDGQFRGVLAADIRIEDMYKAIVESEEQLVDDETKLILDRNGAVVCYTGMDDAENQEFMDDFLKQLDVDTIISNDNGTLKATVNSKEYLIAYDTATTCDWNFVEILPYDSIIAPSEDFDRTIRISNMSMIACFVVLFIALLTIAVFSLRNMLKPLRQLSDSISEIDEDNLEFHSEIKSKDEIELLGNKFEMAFTKAKEYMENLATAEAERQRIGTELSIATRIQAGYVPNKFPAFPDRNEFEIYATMKPAKEVGGDFYDFFLIDEDHLCLVMADVSGKGVGAAMYMMISKTFINGQAHSDMSPASILQEVNNRLCEDNTAEMFVTAWLGILDIPSGKITAANAGHEYPFIFRAGEGYEILKDKHGLALGAYPDIKYTEYEILLNKGDGLFIYTDGVAEATNAENDMFGTDRTLKALNIDTESSPEQVIANVKAGIDEFVKGAPQFDDITMLALKYFGSSK